MKNLSNLFRKKKTFPELSKPNWKAFTHEKETLFRAFERGTKREGIAKKNNKGSRKDDPQGNNFPWGEKVSFASKGTIIVPLNPCRVDVVISDAFMLRDSLHYPTRLAHSYGLADAPFTSHNNFYDCLNTANIEKNYAT